MLLLLLLCTIVVLAFGASIYIHLCLLYGEHIERERVNKKNELACKKRTELLYAYV